MAPIAATPLESWRNLRREVMLGLLVGSDAGLANRSGRRHRFCIFFETIPTMRLSVNGRCFRDIRPFVEAYEALANKRIGTISTAAADHCIEAPSSGVTPTKVGAQPCHSETELRYYIIVFIQ
jgi:hypothetical protein